MNFDPIQINLGFMLVEILRSEDADGAPVIFFRNAGDTPLSDLHYPQKNEVYIKFHSIEAALELQGLLNAVCLQLASKGKEKINVN